MKRKNIEISEYRSLYIIPVVAVVMLSVSVVAAVCYSVVTVCRVLLLSTKHTHGHSDKSLCDS